MWIGEAGTTEREATKGLSGRVGGDGLGARLIAMARAAAALHLAREASWAREAHPVEWVFVCGGAPHDHAGASLQPDDERALPSVELA